MFYMGDEYGHTKGGNNNTYCHDHYVSAMPSYIVVINFADNSCNPPAFYVCCAGQLFSLG